MAKTVFRPFKPFRYASQPWKTLYFLLAVPNLLFLQLPSHILLFLLPAGRPRRSWSFGHSLQVWFYNVAFGLLLQTGLEPLRRDPKEAPKDAEKIGWVRVPALTADKLAPEVVELAKKNGVELEYEVSGTWYGQRGPEGKAGQRAEKGQKVLLYFHGGGYTLGTSDGSTIKEMAKRLLSIDERYNRLFALDFRTAQSAPFQPKNACPAQLIDALAGWGYLLSLGFKPEDIILTGESSGGHLAFALGHYLAHHPELGLGRPAGLLLMSPSVDFSFTHREPGSSLDRNRYSDLSLAVIESQYSLDSLRGHLSREAFASDPILSPGSLSAQAEEGFYGNMPPTLVHAGEAELALDAIRLFRDRMMRDNGQDGVVYVESRDMTHGGFLFAEGREMEGLRKAFGEWMARC